VAEEELARTPLPSPVKSNASASSSVAARQVPGSEGRRMMAFALGLDFALGFVMGFVLAVRFEVGFGVGLVVWGCGRAGGRGRVDAEVDAAALVVVVVVADADRASVGCGMLCRDGGGERRFRVVWGGAAIGEDEREITSGMVFAGAGLGATAALSDGGGLVAL
jgi:hypothetical protein